MVAKPLRAVLTVDSGDDGAESSKFQSIGNLDGLGFGQRYRLVGRRINADVVQTCFVFDPVVFRRIRFVVCHWESFHRFECVVIDPEFVRLVPVIDSDPLDVLKRFNRNVGFVGHNADTLHAVDAPVADLH